MERTRSSHDESAPIFSVRAYRDIRHLIPDDALRLSDRLITSDRAPKYENKLDIAERQLIAALLQEYLQRDYPVVFGTLCMFTLLGLVLTPVRDLTYTLVDPRIDFESWRS